MKLRARVMLIVLGLGALAALAPVGWYVGVFVDDALRSGWQKRSLQKRPDFPAVAGAGIQLARSSSTQSVTWPTDPRIPPLVRALGPRSVRVTSNFVELEFHGGFDHYGYRVRQGGDESAPMGPFVVHGGRGAGADDRDARLNCVNRAAPSAVWTAACPAAGLDGITTAAGTRCSAAGGTQRSGRGGLSRLLTRLRVRGPLRSLVAFPAGVGRSDRVARHPLE